MQYFLNHHNYSFHVLIEYLLHALSVGNLCMITGGRNLGRVGTVVNRERHPGSFDIVHIKDSQGHVFATRLSNVFIIGKGTKAYVSLPKGKGIKLSIAEERDKRLAAKSGH